MSGMSERRIRYVCHAENLPAPPHLAAAVRTAYRASRHALPVHARPRDRNRSVRRPQVARAPCWKLTRVTFGFDAVCTVPPASRHKMRRSAAAASSSESDLKRARKEASESVVDALNAGHDPTLIHQGKEIVLQHAVQESLDGIACGNGEHRCFLLTDFVQLGLFLPASVKRRDPENNLLIAWAYVSVLPPDFYSIVFVKKDAPGVYRALPDSKLSLEDYPKAVKSKHDPETAAGFTSRKDLRLVLRPQAFRFFWYSLHEPLLVPGAWPTVRQVMMDGYALQPAARDALAAHLGTIPADASTAWLKQLRAILTQRHWRSATSLPAADDAAPAADAAPAVDAPPAADAPPTAGAPQSAAKAPPGLSTDELHNFFAESIWAWDLDSAVQLPDDHTDPECSCHRFGYTRILEIVDRFDMRASSPTANFTIASVHRDDEPTCADDVHDFSYAPEHPSWARSLACWVTSNFDRGSSRPHPDIVLRCRDGERRGGNAERYFWKTHTCRVWQFATPLAIYTVPCAAESTMYQLHEFLTQRDEYETTFSSSLRVSGFQACGLGDDTRQDSDAFWAVYENGTWELGCSQSVTASKVRALLPFYEPLRIAQRDYRKAQRKTARS